MNTDSFLSSITAGSTTFHYYDITKIDAAGLGSLARLPFSIRVLVENLLRKYDGKVVQESQLREICNWQKNYPLPVEIPFHPARVLMQDFTGVPAVVDLAAMRDAIRELGGDPVKVNPRVPVELVVDHSVQVDYSGTLDSLAKNVDKEYQRNHERYSLLKWAQKNFSNFRVVPPNSGICHQVNLEHLGRVVIAESRSDVQVAFPDTVVGLDSHTPMINGVGVVGWGVGGIEAEAVMLGQPYSMAIPEVIGVRLHGQLAHGVTATDLVLTLTELLRAKKVVEKFVEYFGPGLQALTIPDRATIANMTPEYGATLGFFPVDQRTIDYLKLTGRVKEAALAASYCQANGLFYSGEDDREYTEIIDFDLSSVEPSVAGPSRPQDRLSLPAVKEKFAAISKPQGHELTVHGRHISLNSGSVVIAAITSCTNTSNPYVLIGAGLLAKAAVNCGLQVPAHVKTSFAPGSRAVVKYLEEAGLTPYLAALGFHLTGFGCTTCIGNSGPLHPAIEEGIQHNGLNVAAVLSGNRNFEARIHQLVKSNFLASPLLVIAYALAGRVDCDLASEPLGCDPNGTPVYLRDLWPDNESIKQLADRHVTEECFTSEYSKIFDGDELWNILSVDNSATYNWDSASTYIKNPPYFSDFTAQPPAVDDIAGARALLVLGDSVTTDHISPAGSIPRSYPAGKYLQELQVKPEDFNSYGSRRGNHEVMMRGTFGNIRIKNRMVAPKEGSFTLKFPERAEQPVYEAAMAYRNEKMPLIVLAGSEYGTGSSRDWAAKGTTLLGVKAVLARSFERIHRNNLVGMGVLPMVFKNGESVEMYKLTGDEMYSIRSLNQLTPRQELQVEVLRANGELLTFTAISRLDTEMDILYYQNGGILPYVLRQILAE